MLAAILTIQVRVISQGDISVEEHVDPTGTTRAQLVRVAVTHPNVGEFGAATLTSDIHPCNMIASPIGKFTIQENRVRAKQGVITSNIPRYAEGRPATKYSVDNLAITKPHDIQG